MTPTIQAHRADSLSVDDFCKRYHVSRSKVFGWLRSGVLRGVDVRGDGASRPRWRIPVEALQEFELRRGSGVSASDVRPVRKRRTPANVIQFYK